MTNKLKQRENYPILVIYSTDNSFGFGYRKNNNSESDELFIKKFDNDLCNCLINDFKKFISKENLQKILDLDRRKKSILLVVHDALILTICFAISIFLRNESLKALFEIPVWICFGFSLLIALLGFAFLDVYKAVTRYLTTNIVLRLGCAVLASTIFMILALFFV